MNKIRKLRKIKGLTQVELGRKIGKTEACISQYETGLREPPVTVAKQLAKSLDCEWQEIYEEEPSTKECG